MIEKLTQQEEKRLFNQRIQRVHVAIGISFSFLMYVALFFGLFAIILPYIQAWEKPISHIKIADISEIDYDKVINQVLEDDSFPKNNPITITLPTYMKESTLKVVTQFVEPKFFNPNTALELEKNENIFKLAQFLNHLHYGRPLGEFGWWIFGFMAVAGVFLLVGGFIQIFVIKYKNSTTSQAGVFSKWHREILLWTIVPFLLIVISGVFMNLGKKTAPLMTSIATKGEIKEVGRFIFPVLHPQDAKIDRKNENINMLSINELLKKAQEKVPELIFHRIKLTNWGDSTALIKFEGYNPYMPFLNGASNRPNIVLSGIDGSFISEQKVLDRSWGVIFYDVINYIHLLFSVDDITRMVVFFIMLIITIATGFGNLLYLEKRARKIPIHIPVYQGLGKLSLAVMIGVIPATSLLFVLQWALPLDMENKFLITKGLFAIFWVATFTYSFYRLNSYKVAKEFLYLGGILFILSSIIHSINSNFSLLRLFNEGIYTVLAMDIGLILLGAILILIAYKLPVDREKIQAFWTTKEVK